MDGLVATKAFLDLLLLNLSSIPTPQRDPFYRKEYPGTTLQKIQHIREEKMVQGDEGKQIPSQTQRHPLHELRDKNSKTVSFLAVHLWHANRFQPP